MSCEIVVNIRTRMRKWSVQVVCWSVQSWSQWLLLWFCHLNENIFHASPGRSQRSLDLYKLHILLRCNLFRGAADPKQSFAIDTIALQCACDLMTTFSVSSAKPEMLKHGDTNVIGIKTRIWWDPNGGDRLTNCGLGTGMHFLLPKFSDEQQN